MPDAPLRWRESRGIAYLTVCAPPRNEMTLAFFRALAGLRRDVFPRLSARGLIVHGEGRHFSSGADLAELREILAARPDEAEALLLENHVSFQALESLPFPVVAAVGGCCLGAGLELALACHARIAAPRAVFALPEVSFGLMPGCGGTVRLPRRIGAPKAVELILSGRTLLADEAASIGLVDRIVDRKDLLAAAEEFVLRRAEGTR